MSKIASYQFISYEVTLFAWYKPNDPLNSNIFIIFHYSLINNPTSHFTLVSQALSIHLSSVITK